ncbi:ABC transporter substrate-binding protein [Streptomyces sp. NPDC021098]|uniref:ABC transporter substrate-binding protein n=1 Tax=unclassified Streptomyces TaxID=2593676 RepID=UPI0037AFC5E3
MSAMNRARDWDRRSVLRAVGGVAALGGLAACGSNTGRSSGDGKSIKQMYHAYGEQGTQQAAKKFADAYDKAKVTIEWVPGEYESKLATSLLGSGRPDVFEYHPDLQLVRSKQIVPLDDVIADVKDDFLPEDITANSVDGKIYGIRMIDDPQFFFYRKSLFEDAGVKPPTTFDELIDIAHKLTKGKVKGLYIGQNLKTISKPLVWSNGTHYLTEDHKIAYHTAELEDTLTKARELYQSKSLLLGAPTETWDPTSFVQGLCAIQWCGIWAIPAIQKAFGDDFGIFPFPKSGKKGRPVVYNGGWSTYVSAKAKDVDAAKEFVKWLWIDQKKYQQEWALDYGFHIPARKSIAAGADKLKDGVAAEAVELFNSHGIFDDPYWTEGMFNIVLDAVVNSVRDSKNPASELDKADRKIERELKKLG